MEKVLVEQPAQAEPSMGSPNDDAIDVQKVIEPVAKPKEVRTVVVGPLLKSQKESNSRLDDNSYSRRGNHVVQLWEVKRRGLPSIFVIQA